MIRFFRCHRWNEHRVAIANARAGNVVGGGDWTPQTTGSRNDLCVRQESTRRAATSAAPCVLGNMCWTALADMSLSPRLSQTMLASIPANGILGLLIQIRDPSAKLSRRWPRIGISHGLGSRPSCACTRGTLAATGCQQSRKRTWLALPIVDRRRAAMGGQLVPRVPLRN